MLRRVGEVSGYVTIFGSWIYFEYTGCISYTNKNINGLEDLKYQLRREISHLKDNLDVFDWQLDDAQMDLLDSVS